VKYPWLPSLLFAASSAALLAGPIEAAIVAAMKLPEAPNYSWQTEIVDDARTYDLTGATDRTTDFSLVSMPLTSVGGRRGARGGAAPAQPATVVFRGSEERIMLVDEQWVRPDEIVGDGPRGRGGRGGGPGGPPGMGGPRGRGGRGGGRPPGGDSAGPEPAYSNLQDTLSRPHEEVAIIVAGATDLKVEGEVIRGTLSPTAAALLLVHPGQKNLTPLHASGTVRLWIKDGALQKYETRLEGRLAVEGGWGRREVEVQQTATTTLSAVGTTKVEVPPEAQKKLGPRR